ncbi:hypothetical protein CDAR_397021 [Caerostris darwini]|uniref:Uncharacterized protein n=1 Tax=Caerostris darwini TaxID=1538125 RepID=A0AAV4Q446_9ARAC|nr:hypothetical protein CDAR_397021 [Caerostris darwini]
MKLQRSEAKRLSASNLLSQRGRPDNVPCLLTELTPVVPLAERIIENARYPRIILSNFTKPPGAFFIHYEVLQTNAHPFFLSGPLISPTTTTCPAEIQRAELTRWPQQVVINEETGKCKERGRVDSRMYHTRSYRGLPRKFRVHFSAAPLLCGKFIGFQVLAAVD